VSARVIIACGGSGGHLAPGIALARQLRNRGVETLLIVSRKPVDARFLEKYPELRAERLPGAALLPTPAGLARFALGFAGGLLAALRLLRRERPAVLVGFGGFTTAAPAVVFRLAGVPLVLHEANRVPGRAVRTLGKIAHRVWLPFGTDIPALPARKKGEAGYPVRDEFGTTAKTDARRSLGLPETGKLVLVLGGSQGAGALNEWARDNAGAIAATGAHLLCVTGKTAPATETDNGGTGGAVTRFIGFCDQMPEALAAADIVVTRAGAGAIAECVATGAPPVLVPLPTARDGHQDANARHIAAAGAGALVPQNEIKTGRLANEVLRLLRDDDALANTRARLAALRPQYDWTPLLDEITRLADAAARA